jgi:hypothetical protein
MADMQVEHRSTWGGARSGAGRKSRAEELGLGDGYSIGRGLRSLLERNELSGIERDVHEELKREIDNSSSTSWIRSGFSGSQMLVPWERLGFRDLTALPYVPPYPGAVVHPGGGNLVPLNLEVSQHILGSAAASQVGCRFLPGLRGNVQLSRISQSAVTEWLGETDPAPESDQAFAMLTLSPKRMAATVVYTDQLLRQSDDI